MALLPTMAAQQPNILWIITDDQRADALECYNRATIGTSESALGYVSSPNIDKLAQEGVLFTHSGCNSPASAPSRGSMHTGRYPFRSGIYNFQLTHNTNDFAHPLVPEVMRAQGYQATSIGKTGYYIFKYQEKMGYAEYPFYDERIGMENDFQRIGITDWVKKSVHGKGVDAGTKEIWYFPDGSEVSYYMNRKNSKLNAEDKATMEKFAKDHFVIGSPSGTKFGGVSSMPTDLTLDGRITEEVCNFFDNAGKRFKLLGGREVDGADPSKPQFIHLGYHFPHTPVMPSKEYRDKFLDKSYKVPGITKEEYDKMPPQLRKWSDKTNLSQYTMEEREQAIRDYYAFCAMGDKLIGKTVERFKQYCKDHNQEYIIVLACGDHGWHLGEQGAYAKFTNYLKSNQTAVVVSSSDKKRFPDGKVVDDFLEYVDFAPTFFSAAGCDLNDKKFEYLDGLDLADVVSGKAVKREYVLGEGNMIFGPRAYMRSTDFAFSMRSRESNANPSAKLPPNKDIKWAMECPAKDAEMALFDLRVDPDEQNNVAYDPAYAELAAWFRTKLGNIVLGDRRLECDWNVKNSYDISTFALGSDDKTLDIPKKIIPKVK